MRLIWGCPLYWSNELISAPRAAPPAAYWLKNGTPFSATPMGPIGVAEGLACGEGVTGIRNTSDWVPMEFGFCMNEVLVPLYASYRESPEPKYGLLWSGMAVLLITTVVP